MGVALPHEIREKHFCLLNKSKTSKLSKEKNSVSELFRLIQNIFQADAPEEERAIQVIAFRSASVPLTTRCKLTQR